MENFSMDETATSTRPSRAFIESDRVEGTAVHDTDGKRLGYIKRLIIEKVSGRVSYVVISFGDADESPHAVPWGKLQYDSSLGGYHTNITERQLREAPAFARQEDHDWSDLERGDELDAYYSIPAHLRAI
jgi:hypothetical protein